MKRLPLIAIVLVMLTISLSSGVISGVQSGGKDSPDDIPPVILSHLEGNDIVKFWAKPGQIVSVLYDQWQILLFSKDVNKSYSVTIAGREVFNGSMEGQYLNLSYNARQIPTEPGIVVKITIGNKSWRFDKVRVNHEAIGWDPFDQGKGKGSITITELNWERFKTAVGVIIASVVTIPIVWFGVRRWRDRQGVVQW